MYAVLPRGSEQEDPVSWSRLSACCPLHCSPSCCLCPFETLQTSLCLKTGLPIQPHSLGSTHEQLPRHQRRLLSTALDNKALLPSLPFAVWTPDVRAGTPYLSPCSQSRGIRQGGRPTTACKLLHITPRLDTRTLGPPAPPLPNRTKAREI